MEKVEIGKYHLNKLDKLITSRNVNMTEGIIYFYPIKNQWESEMKIIKSFFLAPSKNKLKILNILDENRYSLNRYKELVLPEKLITNGGEAYGILMKYISGANFSDYLQNDLVPFEEKIRRFREIGNFLDIMEEFRKYDKRLSNFYIGDIHSSNFLVLKDTIKIIDLDSCTIGNADPSISYYLSGNFKLDSFRGKYDFLDSCKTIMKSTNNTEIYAYTMMFLSFLANYKISSLNIDDYYEYIDYLEAVGMNKELCNSFRNIYTYKENINFHESLDNIGSFEESTSMESFQRYRKDI